MGSMALVFPFQDMCSADYVIVPYKQEKYV